MQQKLEHDGRKRGIFSSCQECWKELSLLCTGSIFTLRENVLFLVVWNNKVQAPDSVGSRMRKSCCLLFLNFIPGSTGIFSAEWAVWGGLLLGKQRCARSLLDWLTKRAFGYHAPKSQGVHCSRLLGDVKIQGRVPVWKMRDFVVC